MVAPVRIAGREVGPDAPCFVIAEVGVNHDGDVGRAEALVDAAAEAGADAVKFQTFRAETLATADAPKAAYQRASDDGNESQYAMLRRLELDEAGHRRLLARAVERGLIFLSAPFDRASADLLERLDVAAFKVPSGELTNLRLLSHVAAKGRPMIVSTGMATMAEVTVAMTAIDGAGAPLVVLLHCVSAYPAEPADCNLAAMASLSQRFGVPIGWSDHTLGLEVALAAVALGAAAVEKHLTLDRRASGPDHAASMEPQEFAALVRGIRAVESAQGDGVKKPTDSEREIAAVARRSLVTVRAVAGGEALTADAVVARRPGTGIPPAELDRYLGRRLKAAVAAATVLHPEMFE